MWDGVTSRLAAPVVEPQHAHTHAESALTRIVTSSITSPLCFSATQQLRHHGEDEEEMNGVGERGGWLIRERIISSITIDDDDSEYLATDDASVCLNQHHYQDGLDNNYI